MRIKLGVPSIFGVIILVLDWKGRYDAGTSLLPTLTHPIAAIAVLVALALLLWDLRRSKREVTFMITPLYFAITMSVIALLGWGWFAFDRARGPIDWIIAPGSPLSWQRAPGEPLWIIGFQITAHNRWNNAITPTDAFVTSETTGETVPLSAIVGGRKVPVFNAKLPGSSDIMLSAPFPRRDSDPSHITQQLFKQRFAAFKVTMAAGAKKFSHRFTEGEVDRALGLADTASQQNKAPDLDKAESGNGESRTASTFFQATGKAKLLNADLSGNTIKGYDRVIVAEGEAEIGKLSAKKNTVVAPSSDQGITLPKPTGEFKAATNSELRTLAAQLEDELRRAEGEHKKRSGDIVSQFTNATTREQASQRAQRERAALQVEDIRFSTEYLTKYLPHLRSLSSEMFSRIGDLDVPEDKAARRGANLVSDGALAGSEPYAWMAAFLTYLSAKLPN